MEYVGSSLKSFMAVPITFIINNEVWNDTLFRTFVMTFNPLPSQLETPTELHPILSTSNLEGFTFFH